MKHLQITLLLGALIVGMPLLPLLAQTAGSRPPAAPPTVMGAMVDTCQKTCDTIIGTIADLTKTVAAVKTTDDVAKLHAALDQVQAGLVKMDALQKDSRSMMEHMQQMTPGN